MRRQFRVPMAVIAGALLGLIALLASLQYRWLGQISGAERDRMKATLNNRATAFAQDVDRELTRAYLMFQLDVIQAEQAPAAAMTARYDRWQASARYPRMVKDIYIVAAREGESVAPLQHFDSTTRFLEPVEWPAILNDVRVAIERAVEPAPPGSQDAASAVVMRPAVASVWSSVPALVISAPLLMVSHLDVRPNPQALPLRMSSAFRYTIVLLDADYMKNEMLPALAQLHFQGTGDGFDYQLAVVPVSAGQPALYHSVRDFNPSPDANADARIELFQVRPRDFEALVSEVARFTTVTAIPRDAHPGTRTETIVRQSFTSTDKANVTVNPAPFSIVVQSAGPTPGAPATRQRIGAMLSSAAASFGTRATTPVPGQWRLLI